MIDFLNQVKETCKKGCGWPEDFTDYVHTLTEDDFVLAGKMIGLVKKKSYEDCCERIDGIDIALKFKDKSGKYFKIYPCDVEWLDSPL